MKYELVLRGYDGSSDKTDELVIWVESVLGPEEFERWLVFGNLLLADKSGVVIDWSGPLPDSFDTDFKVPEQGVQLEVRIRELVDISTMTQREYRALKYELDQRELVAAVGVDTSESEARKAFLRDLLAKAHWSIDANDGSIVHRAAEPV